MRMFCATYNLVFGEMTELQVSSFWLTLDFAFLHNALFPF